MSALLVSVRLDFCAQALSRSHQAQPALFFPVGPVCTEFIVDAALFDMDGTLVDSIGAVETAWGNKAEELGMDRQKVIEQTHGKWRSLSRFWCFVF